MAEERLIPGSESWRWFGAQHLQRYDFAAARVIGRNTLDIACGVGYGSWALKNAGASSVTGVDISSDAIAYANAHYASPGVNFLQADALTWAAPAPFDAAVCFETIEHLPDPAAFLRRLHGFLRPGGQLILSVPNALQHTRANPPIPNPYHISEPDYATLLGWLAPWFSVQGFWEQSTILPPPSVGDLQRAQLINEQPWGRRAARRFEHFVRGIFRRPLPDIPIWPHPSSQLALNTCILPCLPERRDAAEVFIAVCSRKEA